MNSNVQTSPNDSSSHTPLSPSRRWTLRGMLGCLAAALLALIVLPAQAATPLMSGVYATPTRTGTIKFIGLRAFRGGMEGRFVIDGKGWPGSTYAATSGGTGLVWYYGTSGIMAGNALVTLQPDGAYSGPIWFFNRKGNATDTGTARVTFP